MAVNVDVNKCCYCGGCVSICKYDAITLKETVLTIDNNKCIECNLCVEVCPAGALFTAEKEEI
ncbi:MAG: 4Fe-4S dicluster domain-containing protein [Candidatus Mcinerneyibacterium aminivorans]|uniref:4Fe-4S dicluster domain-containing protein n=1 Tax=Candidatus Mcinerneyibacterium aminivorans TaxID=2703815 RepID=A0A5D0MKL9_9BACT|nr:MAG: 4Fe-4S dicluster domain-containing protein [Candidatus Mcinerneyibacterium aminivorans]